MFLESLVVAFAVENAARKPHWAYADSACGNFDLQLAKNSNHALPDIESTAKHPVQIQNAWSDDYISDSLESLGPRDILTPSKVCSS